MIIYQITPFCLVILLLDDLFIYFFVISNKLPLYTKGFLTQQKFIFKKRLTLDKKFYIIFMLLKANQSQ